MSLTKEQRESLPDSDFAVPGKRALPIHDERHVRMAWSQLPRTQGLTETERKSARAHILKRARELGMDTKEWEVHAISFQLAAMSIGMPDVPDHPNRMPFSGVLTRIDEPSDEPPGGSGGKRVLIPMEVAEEALPTLLGMAIDYTENFDGHNSRAKIGVISEATIEGNAVNIAGFLYASDFPEECARIQKEKNRLGFSYECKVAISDMDADPWVVTRIIFTGAAVLYKDKAAYRTTSIAAQATQELILDAKELNAAIAAAVGQALKPLSDSVTALSNDVKTLKAGKGVSLAGPIIDQCQPHIEACNACADAMEAAGIGTHPTKGHVKTLRHMAGHLAACAVSGRLPHIYREHDYLEDSRVEAGAGTAAAAVDTALKAAQESFEAAIKKLNETNAAELKKATDAVASLTTQVKDLEAKAFARATPPERKTLSAANVHLLDKLGIKQEEAGEKINAATIDRTLEAAKITGRAAMEAKLNLRAAGFLN